MKYTIEDIKALANVEKKIVENDKEKISKAIKGKIEELNLEDIYELFDVLYSFKHINYNYTKNYHTNCCNGCCNLNEDYYLSENNNGWNILENWGINGAKKIGYLSRNGLEISYDRDQVKFLNLFIKNKHIFKDYLERLIEDNYNLQLERIKDIANREY